jgi:hypothetical protein
MYSVKPHENYSKKVSGVYDVSTRGGKTMVHGGNYAQTLQHIDLRLYIMLSALLGVYFWHADVANAFAEAELLIPKTWMARTYSISTWEMMHPPRGDIASSK